jgi:hypothetical protein
MKFVELSAQDVHERAGIFVSNLAPGVKPVFQEYFDALEKSMHDRDGAWYQLVPGWIQRDKTIYEFAHYFDFKRALPAMRERYEASKSDMHSIAKEIAEIVLNDMRLFSARNIKLPRYIFVEWTMRSEQAGLNCGAIISVNAPYWLFRVQAALPNERPHMVRYVASSLLHEMEHAATAQLGVEEVFEDHEALTTFVEYLSAPPLLRSVPEENYLGDVEQHFAHDAPMRNAAHAIAFYMSLVIFVDFLRSRVFNKKLGGFRQESLHGQFEILRSLRRDVDRKLFLKFGMETREMMYRTGSYAAFCKLFKRAESEIGMKAKLDLGTGSF